MISTLACIAVLLMISYFIFLCTLEFVWWVYPRIKEMRRPRAEQLAIQQVSRRAS